MYQCDWVRKVQLSFLGVSEKMSLKEIVISIGAVCKEDPPSPMRVTSSSPLRVQIR